MTITDYFSEQDGRRIYSSCPICFSDKIFPFLKVKDYTLSDETFEVLKCDNCGGRFTQNIPVESEIGKYYQSEEYISHTDTSKGLVNSLYQIVRNYTLGTKRKLVEKSSKKDKGSILDIGCGTGDFLKAMKDSGWETLGLEPDDRARKVALSKNGIKSEFSTHLFEIQAASFDVVSMWHVLEHVHELHKYLDTIFKILKDDGVLIIAVPNYQSSDAHHYKDKWAAYDVPRHLYHFSPESMDKLLDSHDFQIFSEKHMPFDSFYVSMLSEKYKTGSTRLVPAFMNGAKSFVNALNKPEKCSSVLYLARKK